MKNTISLNMDHPAAKRAEFFLNEVDEALVEIPFDWHAWEFPEPLNTGAKFRSEGETPVTITVILCDSYHQGNEIGKINRLPESRNAKWGVNGDILYYVESDDTDKVSTLLSIFAGEE